MSSFQNEVSDDVNVTPSETTTVPTYDVLSTEDKAAQRDAVVMASEPVVAAAPTSSVGTAAPFIHPMATRVTETLAVQPSECNTCSGGSPSLVYALGELDVDFGTEARRDSFTQSMGDGVSLPQYLAGNPQVAQSLHWIIKLDSTPIYSIGPIGAFAHTVYQRLIEFFSDDAVERISVPGQIAGQIQLLSGQTVPVILPDLRGMYSWSNQALVDAVTADIKDETERVELRTHVEDYLTRIYYDFRNLGVTPHDRALNFSAVNSLQVLQVLAKARVGSRALESIGVEKSPICRPGSDCYDVKLRFFDPENSQRARRVFRFTIDVSDTIPVTVGVIRSWNES